MACQSIASAALPFTSAPVMECPGPDPGFGATQPISEECIPHMPPRPSFKRELRIPEMRYSLTSSSQYKYCRCLP